MTKPSQIHILYNLYSLSLIYHSSSILIPPKYHSNWFGFGFSTPECLKSYPFLSANFLSSAAANFTERASSCSLLASVAFRKTGDQRDQLTEENPFFARRTSLASVASASNKSLGMLCALRKATSLPKGPWPLQTSNEYPRIMRKLFFGMAEIQTLEFQWSYGHLQYVLYQWSVSTLNPVVHFLGSLKPSCNIKTKAGAT